MIECRTNISTARAAVPKIGRWSPARRVPCHDSDDWRKMAGVSLYVIYDQLAGSTTRHGSLGLIGLRQDKLGWRGNFGMR